MCLLPPLSFFLLTLVTDFPNSCCPTYCFASATPAACLRRMSLEVMTILCRCENIETSEGVPLDVTGVAQVMHFKSKKNNNKTKTTKQWLVLEELEGQPREMVLTNMLTLCVFFLLIFIAFSFSSQKETISCH